MVSRCLNWTLWQKIVSHNNPVSTLSSTGFSTTVSLKAEEILCWRCKKTLSLPEDIPLFFCPCEQRVILPPTSKNYFKIMSCPLSYRMEIARLKNTYKQLQRELHPDKFSIKSQEERDYSAEQSSIVNKAYSTLLSPYTRGLYLLKLNGLTIDEKDNTVAGSDLEFLEEVMTLNEELDHLRTNPDPVSLKSLGELNHGKLLKVSEQLDMQFEQGDMPGAKETLARMKYFVNIEEQIHHLLPLDDQV